MFGLLTKFAGNPGDCLLFRSCDFLTKQGLAHRKVSSEDKGYCGEASDRQSKCRQVFLSSLSRASGLKGD